MRYDACLRTDHTKFFFTPGSACDKCFNGNKSAIHWDLVYIQTPEYSTVEGKFTLTM